MSVAQPPTSLCKACGQAFGFPVEYCACCGVAQRQSVPSKQRAPAAQAGPLPDIRPEQARPAAPDAAGTTRADTPPQASPFRSGPEGASDTHEQNEFKTGHVGAEAKQQPATLRKAGNISVILAVACVLALSGLAGALYRPAKPPPETPPPAIIHLMARGRSGALSFTQGERVTWSYKPCAAPALPACVELTAAEQERFTLGGRQNVSDGRVTGHYTFHRDLAGRLRSSADESMDVEIQTVPP